MSLIPLATLKLGRLPGALGLQLLVLATCAGSFLGMACARPSVITGLGATIKAAPRLQSLLQFLTPSPTRTSASLFFLCLGMLALMVHNGWQYLSPNQSGHTVIIFLAMIESALAWSILTVSVAQALHYVGVPPWIAVIASMLPVAIGVPIDSLLLYYGSSRFVLRNIGEASAESLSAYVTTRTLLVVTASIIFALGASLSARGALRVAVRPKHVVRNFALAAACAALPLTYLSYLTLAAGGHFATYINTLSLRQRCAIVVEHPLIRVADQLWRASTERITTLTADEARARSRELGISLSVGQTRNPVPSLVASGGLRGTKEGEPPIIVLVFVESLGGCFLQYLNPGLPGVLMPNLERLAKNNPSLNRYRAVNFPTTPALCSSIASHPNFRVVEELAYRQSFVKQLANEGWDTIFLNSVSTSFDSNNVRFRRLGFETVKGAEHWASGKDAELVCEWGLPDRALFDNVLSVIRSPRSRPLLLVALTCDTHNPNGRGDYRGFEYPESPAWLQPFTHETAWLESFFRLDHDLGALVHQIQTDSSLSHRVLLVITGDHNPPLYGNFSKVLGLRDHSLTDHVPFVMISGIPLPPIAERSVYSQLDLAPTILHLAGCDIPSGYWGNSVFDVAAGEAAVVTQIGEDNQIIDGAGAHYLADGWQNNRKLTVLDLLLRSYVKP